MSFTIFSSSEQLLMVLFSVLTAVRCGMVHNGESDNSAPSWPVGEEPLAYTMVLGAAQSKPNIFLPIKGLPGSGWWGLVVGSQLGRQDVLVDGA